MAQEYKREVNSSTEPCQIQKIYTTGLYLCLSIRVPGKTHWWWIGRQAPHNHILRESIPPLAKYRALDSAVEWIRSRYKGRWLHSIEYDQGKNQLKLIEADQKRILILGYKNNVLHFLECNKNEDTSWFVLRSDAGSITKTDDPNEIDYFDSNKSNTELNPSDELERWYKNFNNQYQKKNTRKIKNKISNIEKDLQRLRLYPELYEIAQNHQRLMEKIKLEIKTLTIKFNSSDSAYTRADKVFSRAKRFKAAIKLQENRLEKEKALLLKRELGSEVPNINKLPWKFNSQSLKTKTDTSNVKKTDYEVFYLASGATMAIGKTSQANDYLRKEWAAKDDLWVHIEDQKSGHLFLKQAALPDQVTWTIIASILRDYAGIEFEQINLVWTTVRNLKAVKGSPGMVRFSKEKRIMVDYNPQWRNLLTLR